MSLLPVAAIYGGNASGKTNLFKALSFAKNLIVKGTQPESHIPVEPFRLDSACLKAPTRLCFELFTGNRCYEFGFKVTSEKVVEEWLVEIRKTTEKELYHRHGMNPKKLGGKANHKQEPWKLPFPEFIEELYFKRFGKTRPDNVRSVERIVQDKKRKKVERKARKQKELDR